ncbi:MAG TPA: hypothetical protein ENH28_02435 [Euryarchaeota archaeon]|nr:hypothetical protein [Euryarchaeota archaeon]
MKEFLAVIVNVLTFIVLWLVVPAIMAGLVLMGRSIANKVPEGENKIAARAGWWAGLVLFVIYFIYKMPSFRVPEITVYRTLELNLWGVILGILVGFVLLWILRKWVYTKVIGFVILLLVFSGTSLFYSYFFIRTFNEIVLSSTLGIAFGVLVHIIVMPKSIQGLFPAEKTKKE